MADRLTFGIAGVPRELAQTRNHDRILGTVASGGIELVYPLFQYQEAPVPKTLGFEVDFAPPCSPDDPAFRALRKHGLKLIVPSNVLYDPGRNLPPMAQDPLVQLINCAGREHVFGVLSFDEPVHNGLRVSAVQNLYERVKAIDPNLKVMMVHAGLVIEPGRQDTKRKRSQYLGEVAKFSRYADIVGFSLYPIPPEIAKMGSPNSGGQIVDHVTAIQDYLAWLRQQAPGKQYMAVLQSFGYAQQYSPELRSQFSREIIEYASAPSGQQFQQMIDASVAGGADYIVWYGSGFATAANDAAFRNILNLSARNRGR